MVVACLGQRSLRRAPTVWFAHDGVSNVQEISMEFDPIEALNDAQTEDLHRFYQSEWWTRGRTLAETRRMLQHSDVLVGFCPHRRSGLSPSRGC
jgi:hypothetical protein